MQKCTWIFSFSDNLSAEKSNFLRDLDPSYPSFENVWFEVIKISSGGAVSLPYTHSFAHLAALNVQTWMLMTDFPFLSQSSIWACFRCSKSRWNVFLQIGKKYLSESKLYLSLSKLLSKSYIWPCFRCSMSRDDYDVLENSKLLQNVFVQIGKKYLSVNPNSKNTLVLLLLLLCQRKI